MAPSRARVELQSDLKAAAERDIPNVCDVKKGECEEEFTFTFDHPKMKSKPKICVMLQELAGYPAENMFLVYTNQDLPAKISKELERSMDKTSGMRIAGMLHNLSHRLRNCLEPTESIEAEDLSMADLDADDNDLLDIDESDDDDVPFEYGDEDDFDLGVDNPYITSATKTSPSTLKRIRQDFRAVRDAGFKVGRICGFENATEYNIVSTSVRVDKLRLSEEILEAWNLSNEDYIVLLIQYAEDYSTYENIIQRPSEQSRIKFRLRKCSKYRPTLSQAIAAFTSDSGPHVPDSQTHADPELLLLRVGESLDMFLDKDFIPLMKLRKQEGVSWDVAKKIHSELVKSLSTGLWPQEDPKFSVHKENEERDDEMQLPPIIANDYLSSSGKQMSFPLIATQFALRYFVRCTDYCMICHEKVTGNFESIKPYVCSDSLCLFQYMSLGFGPSIDHEIINEPYVVDLLTSFCYSSLVCSIGMPRMRELPSGLSLSVPNIRRTWVHPGQPFDPIPQHSSNVKIHDLVLINPLKVSLDWESWESLAVTFNEHLDNGGWREGQWVVLCTPLTPTSTNDNASQEETPEHIMHHGRIQWKAKQSMQIHIASRHMIPLNREANPDDMNGSARARCATGYLLGYDQNLDDLPDFNKALSMMMVLASTPPVMEMRSYLMGGQARKLATWNRMTPAAMGLLRWIVASNRSYIVQVDKCPGQDDNDASTAKLARHHERISGVNGWIQFRFAQGSPEKEALFQDALKEVEKPQRTLVAWHGSPLSNWHSIIRHGLDYAVPAHGRAYGNGVYFSRDFDYSLSYTDREFLPSPEAVTWPQSVLKVTSAISLNELVNLPERYVYSQSCFVVQHCHWIQCRYLFVRSKDTLTSNSTQDHGRKGVQEFVQDPKWTTTGPRGNALVIPRIAIPFTRDRTNAAIAMDDPEQLLDSDEEDEEDVTFLFDDEEAQSTPQSHINNLFAYARPGSLEPILGGNPPPTPTHQEPQTDFRPGTLDFSRLLQLAPPSYSTEPAQRAIGRELKRLQKVQSTEPLHELGWYIDFEKVNNMFQWIVELHSFDAGLPLAKDMKEADITSIVVEIRFLREFPMSPPFVRVIRPRFLPFMNGGGGHVTSGGAMCMELLTNTGWSPANSMESVLLQVRMAMCNVEPTPARLLSNAGHGPSSQYGVAEAIDAYIRAAAAHQWEVPKDLYEASMEMRTQDTTSNW